MEKVLSYKGGELREPGQAAPPGGINHEAAKGAGEKRGWIFSHILSLELLPKVGSPNPPAPLWLQGEVALLLNL